MESLELKKAIFYPTEIILMHKKGNVTIKVEDIDHIIYTKRTLITMFLGTPSKLLTVFLNKKINNKKSYNLIIEYKDVLKLQDFFQKRIDILT